MKLIVVLVTFNRINDLKKTLNCYDNQTKKMEALIIINNASTDGTYDYLENWKREETDYKKIVVHSEENTGGSGGFYNGIQEALKYDCDYVFLADDDAFAECDMLENVYKFYDNNKGKKNIAGMCTSVINKGNYDLLHRRRVNEGLIFLKNNCIDKSEYEKEYFEVDDFSFVGAIISKEIILKIGLPKKEYFIYFDDTEYSTRIRKYGKIYCIPSAKMEHNTDINAETSWRDYYILRNYLNLIKTHYPLKYFYSYLIIEYLKKCTFFGVIAKHRSKAQIKMFKKAIKDSIHDNICKDNVYYPGIDIEEF